MAELTRSLPGDDRTDGGGSVVEQAQDRAGGDEDRGVHARAVRVRLAQASQSGGDPVIRVEPAEAPLRMTNPSVGVGPFGGLAVAPAEEAEEAVSTQRHLLVDGAPTDARVRSLGGGRYALAERAGGSRLVLETEEVGSGIRSREVLVDGFRLIVEAESERIAALRERATRGRSASGASGPLQVKAIIPGKVVAVSVAPGEAVTAGQQLLVVEAMKMQNELRAPRDGTVERVGVSVGVNIEIGDLLVVIS
jgi:glutaconyl-CoA/methylmalonyl-CoA decarboxylase subunit gamma